MGWDWGLGLLVVPGNENRIGMVSVYVLRRLRFWNELDWVRFELCLWKDNERGVWM
jgi:hypothetical protein